MHYIVRHPAFIFLLFTFPLLGWLIHKSLSKKIISTALYISLALILPILTGYSYIINNAYGGLAYIAVTFAYALMHETAKFRIWPTIILTAALFPICLYLSFIGAMGATVTVEGEWNLKGYKVEHVADLGFAGPPLRTYELSKYAMIPLFIKHIESKLDYDTTNSCWVRFEDAGFNYNKCQPDSSYQTQKPTP